MKYITAASLKNLSDRLVEMGLLPVNCGNIKLASLPANLSDAIRRLGKGCLLVVTDMQTPMTGQKIFRLEIRNQQEIKVTYVLPRDHQ